MALFDAGPGSPAATPLELEAQHFAAFWDIYPRKTGKGQARPAFTRALRKEHARTILLGAARYRDDPNRDATFTKHPATWLNGECWNDDPLPPREGATPQRSQRERRLLAGDGTGAARFAEALGHHQVDRRDALPPAQET